MSQKGYVPIRQGNMMKDSRGSLTSLTIDAVMLMVLD